MPDLNQRCSVRKDAFEPLKNAQRSMGRLALRVLPATNEFEEALKQFWRDPFHSHSTAKLRDEISEMVQTDIRLTSKA
jgi:hypothetical protein